MFLSLVHKENMNIAKAARTANIGYENAKVINRVYKQQGRLHKLERKNADTIRKVRISTLGRSAVISGMTAKYPKRIPFVLFNRAQDKNNQEIKLPSIMLTENSNIYK